MVSSHITVASPGSIEPSWEVWLYVLGELSPAETTALEARLEQDLALCQEVAAAVEGLANLHAAAIPLVSPLPVPASQSQHSPFQLPALTALSLACLTMGGLLWTHGFDAALADRSAADSAAELVHLWRDGSQHIRPTLAIDLDDNRGDLEPEAALVPSWLLAAVSLEQSTSHPETPDDHWETN